MKNEINNRGHWLASVMLGGTAKKKRDFPYSKPLVRSRKDNTALFRESDLTEKTNYEKAID